MADLKDPCGNPLPVALPSIPDIIPVVSIPSYQTLKNMLLPYLPAIEPPTPCPAALDLAKDAAK